MLYKFYHYIYFVLLGGQGFQGIRIDEIQLCQGFQHVQKLKSLP